MKNFRRAAASILVVLASMSVLADWSKIDTDFRRAKSHDEAVNQLKKAATSPDENLRELLDDYDSATTKAAKDATFDSIKQVVSANSLSEKFSVEKGAESQAKKIKTDPIYKAEREATSSNWLQKLWERMTKGMDNNKTTAPDLPQIPAWVGTLVKLLFYAICLGIVVGIIYLITKIPWAWTAAARAKKAKRGGMLEEGETLLSEDEYLLEADRLVAEGRYREACRALFLASLLRIDKKRVARFEPAETNWEHLRRIESSKARPPQLEFRPVTKAFDLAWYGYRAKSAEDVLIFRDTYISVKMLTEGLP